MARITLRGMVRISYKFKRKILHDLGCCIVPKVFVVLRGHVEQRVPNGVQSICATGIIGMYKYWDERTIESLLLPLVEVSQGSGLLRPWYCVGHPPTRSCSDGRNESGDAAGVVFSTPEQDRPIS
jgi:hypothetical protein